jgi:hypothetical protein
MESQPQSALCGRARFDIVRAFRRRESISSGDGQAALMAKAASEAEATESERAEVRRGTWTRATPGRFRRASPSTGR